MKTNFDHTFENKRLDMLKHQFFSNMDVSGEILFRSLDDDHRIDSARFIFDDEINSYIKSSGFKNLIMVLLDDLSFYLQRLSTDFTVFFLRHAGGICPCPDFTLYSEVGDNMEYAVFSDDRIFCDGNAGKCADPPVFCAK